MSPIARLDKSVTVDGLDILAERVCDDIEETEHYTLGLIFVVLYAQMFWQGLFRSKTEYRRVDDEGDSYEGNDCEDNQVDINDITLE